MNQLIVECFIQNTSYVELERIAYIETLDDTPRKLRGLKRQVKKVFLAEGGSDVLPENLDSEVDAAIPVIRAQAMASVLKKLNEVYQDELNSLELETELSLDCSGSLGTVLGDLNQALKGDFVFKASKDFSSQRVVGNRQVEGKYVWLLLKQLEFIYGFEYYITPTREVIIVPYRSGFFSRNQYSGPRINGDSPDSE